MSELGSSPPPRELLLFFGPCSYAVPIHGVRELAHDVPLLGLRFAARAVAGVMRNGTGMVPVIDVVRLQHEGPRRPPAFRTLVVCEADLEPGSPGLVAFVADSVQAVVHVVGDQRKCLVGVENPTAEAAQVVVPIDVPFLLSPS